MSTISGQPKTPKLQLLQGIIRAGLRVFETGSVKTIADTLQIPASSVIGLIHRLVQEGWLKPVKRGVYQLGPATGVSPIHEFEIAMHVVKPAMVSYYSAFYYHGLTEQVPRNVYVSTLKKTSTPQQGERLGKRAGFIFQDLHYPIIQLKPEKFFGGIQAWRGESAFQVSDLERTIIEGFASPQYCGGFSEVMHGLEESLQKIVLDKLIGYALRWDVAVARRVGWALAEFGIENADTLTLAQPKHPGFRLLDPTRPMQGTYSQVWRLRINV